MFSSTLKMLPRTLRAAPTLSRAALPVRVQAARVPSMAPVFARGYASGGGLSTKEIETRIDEVLKSFEKVDVSKVTPEASFVGDLGLDSLDAVEVVMAIEEEFNIVRTLWAHAAGNPRCGCGQHHHRAAGDRLHLAHAGR